MHNPTLPHFLICGGQRCGTTYFAKSLEGTPKINLAKPMSPEPKFFISEQDDKQFERYCKKYFSGMDNAIFCGEKSTSYLDVEGVPARIARFLPDAKLIFLVRHPVERVVSNYFFSKSHGYENLNFSDSIRLEKHRLKNSSYSQSVHPNAYASRSMYARNLKRFYDHFDKQQIKILLFDDLCSKPEYAINQALNFLGLPLTLTTVKPSTSRNESPKTTLTAAHETLHFLLEYFREPNSELAEIIGRDLNSWNKLTPSLMSLLAN